MPSVARFKVRFTPHWLITLFTLLVLLLFLRLGFWQLSRAQEKKDMLTANQRYEKRSPKKWHPAMRLPKQYELISVEGVFLPQVLLLDNQYYHHQLGYHVISPMALTIDTVVLVDRGWVPAPANRQNLPEIHRPRGVFSLAGSAYYPSEKNWLLGPLVEKEQPNIAVVELIKPKLISQFLHKSVYPFIIRLGKQEANGYEREWPIVAMSPERHYAYALQWFAFALIVLLLFVLLNMKKRHETTSL